MQPSNLVGLGGFELPTSPLSGVRSNQLSYRPAGLLPQNKGYKFSPCSLNLVLQHRACNLRYKEQMSDLSKLDRRNPSRSSRELLQQKFAAPCAAPNERKKSLSFRKEVIQPQVLLQLPCYDFTPITNHTVVTCLPCELAQPLLVQPAFVM